VEARDSGVPTWLSTDLDLTIHVRDVNDHPPQFQTDVFSINITEHDSTKKTIQLPKTVDQDQTDDDEEESNKEPICYFIVGGNPLGAFSLDRIKHILRIEKELDREEQAVHIIIVKATERCHVVPETTDFFDPDDDTLLKVVINVNDINDNRPVFIKSKFLVYFVALYFKQFLQFFILN